MGVGILCTACVNTPDTGVSERWITLTPGTPVQVLFSERDGALAGVSFLAGPGAVSEAIAIRLEIPKRSDFIFIQAGGGFEPHTPAVQLTPAGVQFHDDARLFLPWIGLDDDVEETRVRVLRSDGADAIPLGLWEPVSDVTIRTDGVEIQVRKAGIYWAGHWRADVMSQPVTTFGDPCLDATSTLDACTADDECVVSGCFAEICGAAPVATACRPSAALTARRGCACLCSARLCQWMR